MNIVLLSGGSGKRLWPLSNDARSKQFLKLLQNDRGDYESMVQRVYRQIRESGIEPQSVSIAANVSQQESIRNQLGNAVDVVVEPERRNTFPAIALAAAYLRWVKNRSLDEVVVVLPVDPFAELEYFKTLRRMERAVLDGAADLVLMGIKPSENSDKFGYMVPVKGQEREPKRIAEFKEKPDKETASRLIAEGALWNGGVFAFKLGYVVEILRQCVSFTDFDDLYRRYGELNKNSFDYEVVENAKSIAMVSYDGVWKDLGTWDALTEEMYSSCVGAKVQVDESSTGTHVVNELDIPVIVLGAKDLVVAVGSDGILVADKSASPGLKSYAENVDQRPMFEERRWGDYRVIDYNVYDGVQTLTKHLHMKPGKSLSYQKHSFRDEIWTIVDGSGDLLIDGHTRNVGRGDVAYIRKGQKHAMRAATDLHFIEVQIGEQLVEEDIERFDWEW